MAQLKPNQTLNLSVDLAETSAVLMTPFVTFLFLKKF